MLATPGVHLGRKRRFVGARKCAFSFYKPPFPPLLLQSIVELINYWLMLATLPVDVGNTEPISTKPTAAST